MPNQNTVKIKPADGVQVRKPNKKLLDAAGETVELNSYWVRRILAHDVIEIKDEPTEEKTTGAAAGSKTTKPGSEK